MADYTGSNTGANIDSAVSDALALVGGGLAKPIIIGDFQADGAADGFKINTNGIVQSSRTGTSTQSHSILYNGSGPVGSIQSSAGAVIYKAESGLGLSFGANGQNDSLTIDAAEDVAITGGSLVVATDITATAGDITATNGNVQFSNATSGIFINGGDVDSNMNHDFNGTVNADCVIMHGRNTQTGSGTLVSQWFEGDNTSGSAMRLDHKLGDLILARNITSTAGNLEISSGEADITSNSTAVPILDIAATNAAYGNIPLLIDVSRAGHASAFNMGLMRSNVSASPDNEFKFSGDGNGTCDGAWTGGGADYAEYFEWLDGNPDNEDRVGITVTLDSGKIRKAEEGDTLLGVISANPFCCWRWRH